MYVDIHEKTYIIKIVYTICVKDDEDFEADQRRKKEIFRSTNVEKRKEVSTQTRILSDDERENRDYEGK
jgi:hypothetical protein